MALFAAVTAYGVMILAMPATPLAMVSILWLGTAQTKVAVAAAD